MPKILIIEDDDAIRLGLARFLERAGYLTESPTDFETMPHTLLQTDADLILLDLNLPYHDGISLLAELRRQRNTPVLVVTSRDSEVDELISMNMGADDFVRKPYNTEILLLRIKALLRRSRPPHTDWTEFSGLELSPDGFDVRNREYPEQTVTLSTNEAKILNLLLRQKGKTVTRDDLITRLWQSESFIDDNTLSVNVNRLRQKLEELTPAELIETKRGTGYRLKE